MNANANARRKSRMVAANRRDAAAKRNREIQKRIEQRLAQEAKLVSSANN